MLEQIIERVEGTLRTLGIEPADAKTAEGQYNIAKDTHTDILIDVWQDSEKIFFQVMSPVGPMRITDACELYKALLRENHTLVEAAFTLIDDDIFIRETVECSAFFNQERALSVIQRIAFYSESYRQQWGSVG